MPIGLCHHCGRYYITSRAAAANTRCPDCPNSGDWLQPVTNEEYWTRDAGCKGGSIPPRPESQNHHRRGFPGSEISAAGSPPSRTVRLRMGRPLR